MMEEEEIFALPTNAKFGSAARGSNRFAFRDSFAMLDPDVVDLYFQEDTTAPTANSIFENAITDEDLEGLELDANMDLYPDDLTVTDDSSSESVEITPKADEKLISFEEVPSSSGNVSTSSTSGSFAPPAADSAASDSHTTEDSPAETSISPRNVTEEIQQASESFTRPRRRTHYASMISQDDLKQLASQIDTVESERQKIKEQQAKARDEIGAKLELQLGKRMNQDGTTSPRQSPRQTDQQQPAQPAAAPATGSPSPQSFAPPTASNPPVPSRPAPRERPQSMMVSLPSSKPKQPPPPPQQQAPQPQQQEGGWFSKFIGGLRNSSGPRAPSASVSSPSTSKSSPTATSSNVVKAASSPASKTLTPQQQQALEREQKRTAQYQEYLAMAQKMDFSVLKQHKIIYQSGVDFHGRSVVMMIGNIPKDVNWDNLFLFFLATLDPIVEREYVLVYVHLSESSRPQLAWMRKVYSLFQRKWKKNLKQLFIVYPTFFVKTIFRVFRPFVSAKFWSKLIYVDDPKKLYNYMNPTAVQLPDYAMTDSLRAELKRYFGVPLDRLMNHPINQGLEMPQIVESACRALDTERALEQEGIFRLSGTLSRIKELRSQYDQGIAVNLEEERELHVVSGLLKMWLRELPDPLIPYFLYDMFIDNFDKNDLPGTKRRVIDLIISVPLFNLLILEKLFKLLNKISTFSSINKMTTSNLAIVFGPNLLRPEQEQPEFALFHASIIPAIIKFMIESPDEMLGPAIALRREAAAAIAAANPPASNAAEPAAPAAAATAVAAASSPQKAGDSEDDGASLLSMGNRQFGFVRDRSKVQQQRRQLAHSIKTEPLTPEKLEQMAKMESESSGDSADPQSTEANLINLSE